MHRAWRSSRAVRATQSVRARQRFFRLSSLGSGVGRSRAHAEGGAGVLPRALRKVGVYGLGM